MAIKKKIARELNNREDVFIECHNRSFVFICMINSNIPIRVKSIINAKEKIVIQESASLSLIKETERNI